MKKFTFLSLLLLSLSTYGQMEILPKEVQIQTAILAAPEEEKAQATVLGYTPEGKFEVLRKGDGNLVCLADDPDQPGIKVSCYAAELEPFIARGRAILEEGRSETEKREIRKKEADAGELQMPENPSMMYILSGEEENYNKKTGELKDGYFRYVIYMPYATTESTGLPAKPFAPGMPWLMDPGTHRAHIMVTPPKKE